MSRRRAVWLVLTLRRPERMVRSRGRDARQRALRAVSDAVVAIARENRFETVLEKLSTAARQLVDARYAGIGVPDGEGGYVGRAVFVSSRVADAAGGGEILVSEVTRALAGDDGLDFCEQGVRELKGLKGQHRLFEVAWTA
jgi:class 3 adenylate cyclase